MGLIQCPDCGEKISDKAPSCLHCGLPNPASHIKQPPPPPPKKRLKIYLVLQAVGSALLLAGVTCITTKHAEYAFIALLAGLILTTAGGLWGWVANEE